jgi:hypothetical protein
MVTVLSAVVAEAAFAIGRRYRGGLKWLEERRSRRLLNHVHFETWGSGNQLVDAHARRGDFSRWIAEVFHDHLLASNVRKVEQRYRLGHTRDLYSFLAQSIQE